MTEDERRRSFKTFRREDDKYGYNEKFVDELGLKRIPTRDPNGTSVKISSVTKGFEKSVAKECEDLMNTILDLAKQGQIYTDKFNDRYITKELTKTIMIVLGKNFKIPRHWNTNIREIKKVEIDQKPTNFSKLDFLLPPGSYRIELTYTLLTP